MDTLSPPTVGVYRDEFVTVARRVFAMWNRDATATAMGSFDRPYWSWKKRDFGDATLQAAVTLAVEYARTTGRTSTLPPLLEGYVQYCHRIQRRDGSFDQNYPFEGAPGVGYDLWSGFLYTGRSPYLTSQSHRALLDKVMRRAVAFALKTDEAHGDISNHLAHYAYELLSYADYYGDDRIRSKGEAYLERLLSLLDRSEGWFREYSGPDPGYQTRTLRYLVKCAALLEDRELWDVARRGADFVAEMLMPDNSIHPMLGCRSTALLYPSAFEVLAARDPAYGELATRVRDAWQQRRVPMPSWLDFDNAIRLAEDAYDAAEAAKESPLPEHTQARPVEISESRTHFPGAGVLIFRSPRRCTYIAYRLGGVVVVYQKDEDGRWRLACEDSGYVIRSARGRSTFLTRMPGAGRLLQWQAGRVRVECRFSRALEEELTTGQLMLLRLLNLTLLRIRWFGDRFRCLIVRRLIYRKSSVPMTLVREIVIGPESVRILDKVAPEHRSFGRSVRGDLYRCRRVVGTHMASARYFQEQELDETLLGWMTRVPWSKAGEAVCEVRVRAATNANGKL